MKNYRKIAVHRYIKIEKNKNRNYHIIEFNELIKLLYPYRKTINKYQKLLEEKTQFNLQQRKLILNTAHSITIINEMYRDQDSIGQFYVTREDLFNAIFMLQNELGLSKTEYLLSPVLRWYYRQIQYYYENNGFTAKQLRNRMGKGKTIIYENLSELVDRELLEIIGLKGQAYVYKRCDK